MNSIKNIVVIGLLLAVSYGAFQIINSPDPSMALADHEFEDLSPRVEFPTAPLAPPAWPDFPSDPARNGGVPSAAAAVAEKATPPAFNPPHPMTPAIGPGMPPPSEPTFVPGAELSQTPPQSVGSDVLTPSTEMAPIVAPNAEPSGVAGVAPSPAILPSEDDVLPGMIADSVSIDWDEVDQMIVAGQYRQALTTLTTYYRAGLSDDEREQLLIWLDALAGKVIYSTEHWLATHPYVVQPGDTLQSIAEQWQVPPELVLNVNQAKIPNPAALSPGTELKVVMGPFRAEVSLTDQQITLFCKGMYAGRFSVSFGTDAQLNPGTLKVLAKHDQGVAYTDALGQLIAGGDPSNPLGNRILELGDNVKIHAVADAQGSDSRGFIRVSQNDAADIYSILSPSSPVTVVR